MKMRTAVLTVATRRGLTEITAAVRKEIRAWEVREGLCTVFLRHTSASLVIQENADPTVQRDLEAFLSRLVPDGDPLFLHDDEGPDDMPAHARSALTKTSEAIPVTNGALCLGTWQGLYLFEHRARAHTRRLVVHIAGE